MLLPDLSQYSQFSQAFLGGAINIQPIGPAGADTSAVVLHLHSRWASSTGFLGIAEAAACSR